MCAALSFNNEFSLQPEGVDCTVTQIRICVVMSIMSLTFHIAPNLNAGL